MKPTTTHQRALLAPRARVDRRRRPNLGRAPPGGWQLRSPSVRLLVDRIELTGELGQGGLEVGDLALLELLGERAPAVASSPPAAVSSL